MANQDIQNLALLYNSLLDSEFKNFIGYIAHSVQVPHDMALVNLLGGVAAAVNGKFEVVGSKTWDEPVTCYFMIVAKSAERKSSIVKIAKAPHKKWLSIKNERYKMTFNDANNKNIIFKKKIRNLQNKAAKLEDFKSPEFQNIIDEITKFENSMPELPLEKRLFFENVTLISLRRVLAAYGGRICHFEPEGGLFDILKDKKGNVSFFCNAYDGEDGSIDRVNKDHVKIPSPSIQLCVSIQPGIVVDVLLNKRLNDSGLLGRFLYVKFPPLAGYRATNTLPIPEESLKYYEKKIISLLDIPFQKNDHKEGKAWKLRLNYEAREYLDFYRVCAEIALIERRALSFSASWGGKFIGKVLRIAGLLHCIKHDDPRTSEIDKETIMQAFTLGEGFAHHARHLDYYALNYNNMTAGQAILNWVQSIPTTSFTAKDAYTYTEKFSLKNIQNGINSLVKEDVIYQDLNAYAQQNANGVRGAKKIFYKLNPNLYPQNS